MPFVVYFKIVYKADFEPNGQFCVFALLIKNVSFPGFPNCIISGYHIVYISCCECCCVAGFGLCDEPITCAEKPYRVWCAVLCELKNEDAVVGVEPQGRREEIYTAYIYTRSYIYSCPYIN
jgi:hypothetical protein